MRRAAPTSIRTLAILRVHIRERYPDIDLDALWRQASNDAQRRMVEIRKEMRQGGMRKKDVKA
jgi:hypothetical protein